MINSGIQSCIIEIVFFSFLLWGLNVFCSGVSGGGGRVVVQVAGGGPALPHPQQERLLPAHPLLASQQQEVVKWAVSERKKIFLVIKKIKVFFW